jgi:hypothetical protein
MTDIDQINWCGPSGRSEDAIGMSYLLEKAIEDLKIILDEIERLNQEMQRREDYIEGCLV